MKVNDYVTRISHNNDVLFQIIGYENNKYILKGEDYRLIADSYEEDLILFDRNEFEITLPKLIIKNDNRNTLGRVLHLDGDPFYLKKSMEAYHEYKIPVDGFYVKEENMVYCVNELLSKNHYDILVLTGHDAKSINIQVSDNDLTSYKNSYNYLLAINEARKKYSGLDELVIVAGACQSHYEALINAGANIASSPRRKNIHLLDPIVVASTIALTRVSEYVDMEKVINSTISKEFGGIETRGRARRSFNGGS